MADSRVEVKAALSSAAFSDHLQLRGEGGFQVDISGTFSGTLQVQACKPGAATNYRVLGDPVSGSYALTATAVYDGSLRGSWDVRVGFSAFTSGTANIVITAFPEKGPHK